MATIDNVLKEEQARKLAQANKDTEELKKQEKVILGRITLLKNLKAGLTAWGDKGEQLNHPFVKANAIIEENEKRLTKLKAEQNIYGKRVLDLHKDCRYTLRENLVKLKEIIVQIDKDISAENEKLKQLAVERKRISDDIMRLKKPIKEDLKGEIESTFWQ